jgi:predicted enzyme related to lactoylglutathione lyase
MPPSDVSETDRVGVIADPQGAVVGLLQSTENKGAQLVNEPGALSWNELLTEDTNAAKDFYGALFGWTFDDLDMGNGFAYVTHKVGERSNGGMMAKMPGMEGLPNYWGVYFAVQEVEAAAKKAESLGGRAMQEEMEVPGGKFVPIVDPQGASFSIFSGEFDD